MKTTIRILLTLVLIYAVYRETGAFTALAMFLVFACLEAQEIVNRAVIEHIDKDMIKKTIKRLLGMK